MRRHLAIALFHIAVTGCAMGSAPAPDLPSIHVTVDSTPREDFYDKAPVWISLASVLGIMVGFASLRFLWLQVEEPKQLRLL